MANIYLQDLRQYTGQLTDNDLLLFKIKRRVDMPADEDMGVRFSSFMGQLDLDRFLKKAGDTMLGDLVFINNRGVFGKDTTGATRAIFKLDNADRVTVGHVSHPLRLNSSIDPKVVVGGNEFVAYHSGNANLPTVDWRAKNVIADQTLWVNGDSTFGNVTVRKLSAIYGYDAGNLKVRMIGIDADDDVAVGVTSKRLGLLVKDPNEVWAVQEAGNAAKQWRMLNTGNFKGHLDSVYVLKTQTVNGKPLSGNITLNAVDVGALPITGGTLTGNLATTGNIRSTVSIQTDAPNSGNIWIGGNEPYGYAEIAGRFKGESAYAWDKTIRFYQDGTWRIGDKKIFHEGFLPTATALNVYTKDETYSQTEIQQRYTLRVRDLRSAPTQAPKPNQFDPFATSFWFSNQDTPTSGVFYSGMTMTGWEAGTYASWQIASKSSAGGSDQRLWFRASTGADTWGEWARVYTTLDKFTAADIGALPVTGGSINGTLNLNGTMYINCKTQRNHIGFEVANGSYNWIYTDPNSDRLVISSKLTLSGGSIALDAAAGSGSAITMRNWGNASRWAVQETGDTHGYLWYCQRLTNSPTGTVEFSINGNLITQNIASRTIWCTNPDAYRIVYGDYGTYWRQDGTNLYLMLTNSGDQYGSYNGYRPFRVHIPTGRANFDQGAYFGGGVHLPPEQSITFNSNAVWGAGIGWGIQEEASSGNLMFHRYSSTTWQNAPFRLFNDSTVWCEGNVNANDVYIRSDESLKTNLKPLQESLAGVMQLEPTEYDKRLVDSEVYDIHEEGLIAQAVEKIFPNAVHTDTSTGLKSLKPYALIARLIGAVQEQQQQIDDLKKLVQEGNE
jgi:hypothetical protein